MRRVQFAEGECYHVYNRGVEKRDIFLAQADWERFVYVLFACNDVRPLVGTFYTYVGAASIAALAAQNNRQPLVDILCFCLMPNHFHLLLRQRKDRAVSIFMQKIGTAYTMYFNERYDRDGVLFQGTYKAIHTSRDEYLLPLSRYIHRNPLDLREPGGKDRGVTDAGVTRRFLRDYPWSSYGDYCGQSRYAGLVQTDLIGGMFRGPEDYASYVEDWGREKADFDVKLTLEHEQRSNEAKPR